MNIPFFNSIKQLFIQLLLLNPFLYVPNRILILLDNPIDIRTIKTRIHSHLNSSVHWHNRWLSIIRRTTLPRQHRYQLYILHHSLRISILISLIDLIIRSVMSRPYLWLMSWLFIGCKACDRSLLEVKEIIIFSFRSLITDLMRRVFIMGLDRSDLILIGDQRNTERDALFRGCGFWRFGDVIRTLRRLGLVHFEGWLDHFWGVLRRMICLFNSFSINMIGVITNEFRWNFLFFLKESSCRLSRRI